MAAGGFGCGGGGTNGPALLVHGDGELLVPHARTVRFADALRAAGKDVFATIVREAGHGYDHARFDLNEPQVLRTQGETTARAILVWLERVFPQRP